MKFLYKPEYFTIQELVDPECYRALDLKAWNFLDQDLLRDLDSLRAAFGPITINNYHTGGGYESSGLRSVTNHVGAKFSQHRFGKAFDLKFRDVSIKDVAKFILDNSEQFVGITRIENPDITVKGDQEWLHIDSTNTSIPFVQVFNP